MTISYSPAQTASIILTTVDTTALSPAASSTPTASAVLYRFSLDTNVSFLYPVTLDVTVSGISGSETFYLLVMDDPDGIATLTNGALSASLIPEDFSSLVGTAGSYEIGRETFTSSGSVSFDIDMAELARFMSTSLDYTNTWNGSLTIWLCATANSAATWSLTPTITAYDAITYTNRDTGSRGLESSKWSRCPVSGFKVPHGKMVMDGFRSVLVHPDFYDPPEPEAFEWSDRENPNEDA